MTVLLQHLRGCGLAARRGSVPEPDAMPRAGKVGALQISAVHKIVMAGHAILSW